MKIGLMSDMHLEFGPYDGPVGEGDLLLLSGDISVAAYLYMAAISDQSQIGERQRERIQQVAANTDAFIDRVCRRYDTVAWIAGNHEHYGLFTADTLRVIERRYCERYRNLAVLEKEAIEVGHCVLFGATLWTDFNRHDPLTMATAHNSMNDYRQIHCVDSGEERLLRPEDAYADHVEALKALDAATSHAEKVSKPMIVMTHHAPSRRSLHPRYRGQHQMNGCYSSDLEHLMGTRVPLWVHGHTHDSYDYQVNGTRVVCNPRGYWTKDMGSLNKSFKGDLEIIL